MTIAKNIFDFDGVITLGLRPARDDLIITGRSFEESKIVFEFLHARGIDNLVFFNPMSLSRRGTGTEHSRHHSALHKARNAVSLGLGGVNIGYIFEDDPLQYDVIVTALKDAGLHDLSERVVKISQNGAVY